MRANVVVPRACRPWHVDLTRPEGLLLAKRKEQYLRWRVGAPQVEQQPNGAGVGRQRKASYANEPLAQGPPAKQQNDAYHGEPGRALGNPFECLRRTGNREQSPGRKPRRQRPVDV